MAEPVYASQPWSELIQLRGALSPEYQVPIAPYEHRAYARMWAQEDPLRAAAVAPFFIPGYQATKYLGVMHGRTPASWDELWQGFRGLGEGLGLSNAGIGSQIQGVLGR